MDDSTSKEWADWSRPTGATPTLIGGLSLFVAAVAAFIWAVTDPRGYLGEYDPMKLSLVYWSGLISVGCLSLGSLLLLAGYIVRAMYFIDGADKKPHR